MTEFQFLRPLWLLALVPLLPLFYWRLRGDVRSDPWKGIVDARLLRHLRPPARPQPGTGGVVWPLLAGLLAVLALAGPVWDKIPPPQYRSATPPLVIVLDLSRSMNATDLRPSRLALARALVHGLLQRLPPRETGLVVFAGGAHRVMPLTEDRHLIQTLLQQLNTTLMPVQGSNASAGLGLAGRLLIQAKSTRGDILLVTDGVDDAARNRAADLASAGYRLLLLGIGTAQGGPIPDGEEANPELEGRSLRPALDEAALTNVARSGNGIYLRWGGMAETLDRVLQGVAEPRMAAADAAVAPAAGAVWRERGPWLLLLLLPVSLLGFRRGLLGLALLPVLLPPLPAEAGNWQELWLNPNQLARQRLQQGDYRAAADLFQDSLWRGTALYLAGDYGLAVTSLARSDQAMAHYNRGNALLRLGRVRDAIDAYSTALGKDPDYAKARDNLGLARRLLASANRKPPPLSIPGPPDNKRPAGGPTGKPPGRPAERPGERPPTTSKKQTDHPAPDGASADDSNDRTAPPGPEKRGGSSSTHGDDSRRGKTVAKKRAMADKPLPQTQQTLKDAAERPATTMAPGPASPAAAPKPATRPSVQAARARPADAGRPTAASQNTDQGSTSRPRPAPRKAPASGTQDIPTREPTTDEYQQATEHWLQRIPDDSGGLLQELFRREHQRGQDLSRPGEPW